MLGPLLVSSLVGLASAGFNASCGNVPHKPSLTDLIVGGESSSVMLFPSAALMVKPGFFSDSFKCGAVLLSGRYALTTAACVAAYVTKPSGIRLKAGVSDWTMRLYTGEISIPLFSIQLHPEWDAKAPHLHNLAVVRIDSQRGIFFDDKKQPVCLPCQKSAALAEGNPVTLVGWGKTSPKALRNSNMLHSVTVPVASTTQCQVAYGAAFDPSTMFCAGVEGRDACFGDGGSPALVKGADGRYRAVGLISWGQGCGTAGKPGVLERLDAPVNRAFITKATQGTAQCL